MKDRILQIRKDFPILQQHVNGNPLVYFDNAATTQKPLEVIDAISNYYTTQNANVHRGNHSLSQLATTYYENVREKVRVFVNAKSSTEIVFTRGTTEAINLLSKILAKGTIKKGDEILVTEMEHHSNIVPWQMVCEEIGAILKVLPINTKGELELNKLDELITNKTRVFSFAHVSNAMGTINPIKELVATTKSHGIISIIDGAQAASHIPVDVQDIGCDFYCFSGHKIYGPTGIGVIYGKEELLNQLPPYHGGGEMIDKVTFEKTTYNVLPFKFEAGTPNIADTIAFGAALDYVNELGIEKIAAYEHELLTYATGKLMQLEGMQIIGTTNNKTSVLSFVISGIHPTDIGILLDKMGIAVRTGQHCAQPLMDKFKIPGTVRASFAFYNTFEEIDIFIDALQKSMRMLK